MNSESIFFLPNDAMYYSNDFGGELSIQEVMNFLKLVLSTAHECARNIVLLCAYLVPELKLFRSSDHYFLPMAWVITVIENN